MDAEGGVSLTNSQLEEDVIWTGKPWMGKFESTGRQERQGEYDDKLGIPPEARCSPDMKILHALYQKGDFYHHDFAVPQMDYQQNITFQLDLEGVTSYKGTEYTFKYTEENGALIGKFEIPTFNKSFSNHFEVDGDEILKIATIEGVEAKRWFKRQ